MPIQSLCKIAFVFVYPADVLYDAERHVTDPALREHVGIHIYQHPDRYRICNLEAPPVFHHPEFHLEVDTEEDFEVISAIYEHFYRINPGFTLAQVIDFMSANAELAQRNRGVERRWKVLRQDD